MIDPDVYTASSRHHQPVRLDEIDEEIVKDTGNTTRARNQFRPDVPWLRKAEYFTPTVEQTFGMFTERFTEPTSSTPQKDELVLPEERARRISRSFDPPSTYIHPTRKDLKAVEVFPVFPAFSLSLAANHRMSFDIDPLEEAPQHGDKGLLETLTAGTHQKLAVLSVPEGETVLVKEGEEEEEEEGVESKTMYKKHSVFHYELKELEEGEEFVLILEKGGCSYLSLEGVGCLKRKRDEGEGGRSVKKKMRGVGEGEEVRKYLQSLEGEEEEED